MRKLEQFTLNYTLRCPVKCRHCLVNAGPERKETLGFGLAVEAMRSASRAGMEKVVITGGEPLFCKEACALVEAAKKSGLKPIVVTNAFWAKSRKPAREKVQELAAKGLSELWVSVDKYHLENIPFKNVANAIEAAEKIGVPCMLNVVMEDSLEHLNVLGHFGKKIGKSAKVCLMPVHPIGRANNNTKQSIDFGYACCCANPSIWVDGSVFICYIAAAKQFKRFVIGNIKEKPFEEILGEYSKNKLAVALHNFGANKLFQVLKEHTPITDWGMDYGSSICERCLSVFADDEKFKKISMLVEKKRVLHTIQNLDKERSALIWRATQRIKKAFEILLK